MPVSKSAPNLVHAGFGFGFGGSVAIATLPTGRATLSGSKTHRGAVPRTVATPTPIPRPVVAHAMPLTPTSQQRLQNHLGCVVFDIRDAPETTGIVLAPRLSHQAATVMAAMFPHASILQCDYLNDENPIDVPASVVGPHGRQVEVAVCGASLGWAGG